MTRRRVSLAPFCLFSLSDEHLSYKYYADLLLSSNRLLLKPLHFVPLDACSLSSLPLPLPLVHLDSRLRFSFRYTVSLLFAQPLLPSLLLWTSLAFAFAPPCLCYHPFLRSVASCFLLTLTCILPQSFGLVPLSLIPVSRFSSRF